MVKIGHFYFGFTKPLICFDFLESFSYTNMFQTSNLRSLIMVQTFAFYFFSGVAILSSLYVVFTKHPTQGVLALVLTMFAFSGLFVLLGAYFVAIIQILIYAGAILVLFLFMLMLLGVGITESGRKIFSSFKKWVTRITIFSFVAEIFIVIQASKNVNASSSGLLGTVEIIGRSLFSDYLLHFELVSLVLLVGVLGVISLSRKET